MLPFLVVRFARGCSSPFMVKQVTALFPLAGLDFSYEIAVCVCVFFTLNRSSTRRHPAHPVSVLILHPRKPYKPTNRSKGSRLTVRKMFELPNHSYEEPQPRPQYLGLRLRFHRITKKRLPPKPIPLCCITADKISPRFTFTANRRKNIAKNRKTA